eukprot:jgi/Tetstr1/431634/TSEL_021164.t1
MLHTALKNLWAFVAIEAGSVLDRDRSGVGDLTLETSGMCPADRSRPSDLTLAGTAALHAELLLRRRYARLGSRTRRARPLRVAARDIEGQAVVVVGLGVSGRAAVELAADCGAAVVATDSDLAALDGHRAWQAAMEEAGVLFELGAHQPATLRGAAQLVLSPGVPYRRVIHELAGADVLVHSELGFAWQALPATVPAVAVTGTNGKSTVTSFVGQLLVAAGMGAWVGGNFGVPLSELALAQRRGEQSAAQVAVLELSSYQLEVPSGFRPDAAALLNLTPDHLERHRTMEAYAAAKCSVFRHMTPGAAALLPAGDELCHRQAMKANDALAYAEIGRVPGVAVYGMDAVVQLPGVEELHLDLRPLRCPGAHNRVNAAVAAALVAALRLPGVGAAELQAGLGALVGLPHRMQVVGSLRGVTWINDSKATNVDAAFVGINGLEQPAVVLLGGQGKRLEGGALGFARIAAALACHRAVVAFGRDGAEIAEELLAAGLTCSIAEGLEGAVELGMRLAQPGDALLLSPGCASFDGFRSFEHRGDAFVGLLEAKGGSRGSA